MSLIINNNSMANTAARNLNTAYNDLTKSTERLSSGMRINSAADDAAGLAVREMMRAEVTTLNQGVRNANDAISMIQTADGALSVIDEKLIRMNELAEQAATDTYTDEQRQIIDQEFQTMADEINRISDATDFNGKKLLDGSLDSANGGEAMTIHFGTGNEAAEDKYDIEIEDVSADALGLGLGALETDSGNIVEPGTTTAIQYDSDGDGTVDADITQALIDAGDVDALKGLADSGHYDGASIATQEGAQAALGAIKDAIELKDKNRANLGAYENRLSATISNLEIQSENLAAAESRISDVDVATEMTEYTLRQTISQAATSMLAQANTLPQNALSLIG